MCVPGRGRRSSPWRLEGRTPSCPKMRDTSNDVVRFDARPLQRRHQPPHGVVVIKLVYRLRRMGDRPGDDDDVIMRKHALTLMGALVVGAALLWALLGIASDEPGLTMASLAFAAVALLLLAAFARTGQFAIIVHALLAAGLLYVVAAHVALGGLAASGASLTWGLLAPVLAVLLFGRATGVRWLAAYVALVVAAVLADPILRGGGSPTTSSVAFTVFNLVGPGAIIVLLVTFVDGDRSAARAEYRELVHAMLPESIADRLRRGERPIAETYPSASVLFADLANFTAFADRTKPEDVLSVLNDLFNAFDVLAAHHGFQTVKTLGDGYLAVAGAPIAREGHADAALELAIAMHLELQRRATLRSRKLVLRVGVASGPISGGVLGRRKVAWDIWGDVVNVASRMESTGVPGTIQITAETRRLLTRPYVLRRREVDVRGKGMMPTYVLDPAFPHGASLTAPVSTRPEGMRQPDALGTYSPA